MGSYMIFDMTFKSPKDRIAFENFMKKRYCYNRKLTFYHTDNKNNEEDDIVYYVGYLGYIEPEEILKECLKKKIGIKFMAYLCLSDRQSQWEKIRGRW